MKYFEGKSTREKVLIIGLVVSLVFSLYVITRVNTFNKEITRLDKIYKKDAKKLKDLKKKTGNIKPSVEILREVKNLEEKLEVERQNLAGFDIKFINLRDTQLMQDHIKNITLAAEKNQLRILSKQNELRPLASIMGKELKQLHSQPNAKKKVVRKSKKQKQQQQNTLKTGAA
ncbi:MAG: hypothetical protein MI865_12370, partial [Proteobacteria bacterium]|nr:hypothetical protein [Pseudomonadota bacterium]